MDIQDFDISVIYTRKDGSYIINKGLYHVPNNGEYAALWEQVDAYAKEHPEVMQAEPTQPEPAEEEKASALQAQYTALIQSILDTEAQKLGYDNCLSACSYIDTGIAKYDAEGKSFRSWRSDVWEKAFKMLEQINY